MAPAESSVVEADGDGGGRTTPEECESVGRREGCEVTSVAVVPRGEADSFVALPPSDSSGICTFSRGREMLPPTRRLLDRDGGVKVVSGMVPRDPFRLICGCTCVFMRGRDGGELGLLPLETLPTSIDWDLLDWPSDFISGWNAAKCCERMDRLSSMGVNMLPPLRGACFLILVSSRRGWRALSTSSCLCLGSPGADDRGSLGGAKVWGASCASGCG